MDDPLPLRMATTELFEREHERLRSQRSSGQPLRAATLDFLPAFRLVEELLDHVGLAQMGMIEDLSGFVRRRIKEEAFIEQAGDPVIDDRFEIQIDGETRLVVRVLQKLLKYEHEQPDEPVRRYTCH